MSAIQRAARLARSRAAEGLLPFGDTYKQLQQLKAAGTKPVLVLTDKSHAVLHDRTRFVFPSDDQQLTGDVIAVKSTLSTDYAELWLVPEDVRNQYPERFTPLRSLASIYMNDRVSMSYLAHASTTLDLYSFSKYCPRCGTKLLFPYRSCQSCRLERYPRQSPCAIVVVYDPWSDSLLLGQRINSTVWSLLAGFCESLETIEDCAVREVMEESRIELDRATTEIAASQPWPFFTNRFEGTSLMLGCFAQAARPNQIPQACEDELAAVKWFPVKDLKQLWMEDSDILPMKASMARFLLQAFLDSINNESNM